MKNQISILLPVYNAQKYLRQCLDSIFEQTFTDFEVIAINDGSTDDSLVILQEYAAQDKRIRVFSQKNVGIANTRNRLLERANGEYFFFVDSDDWLHKDCLEVLYRRAVQTGADVVQGWHEEYDENTGSCIPCDRLFHLYHGPKPPVYVQDRFKAGRSYLQVWGRLVRLSVVRANHLSFLPNKLAEDAAFSILLYLCSTRIEFVERPLLIYRRSNVNSLSHQGRRMHFDILEQWCFVTQQCKKRNLKAVRLYDALLHLIVKGCMLRLGVLSAAEYKQIQRAVHTVADTAALCSWKCRWRYKLFARLARNASPTLTAYAARFLR